MREWLKTIVHQPSHDFFLNNLEQANSFEDLMILSKFKCTSMTAHFRKRTAAFVADKMVLLLELNQQIVDKKVARENVASCIRCALPKTKLRRAVFQTGQEAQ
jgi:hypothetical protein